MGFKKIKNEFSFAGVVLERSKKNNRSIKKIRALNQSINWKRVEDILLNHYTVGTSNECADAYSPLLLLKCLLFQKWFHIDSDPEFENMINDRLSFKEFLELSLSNPSPDHSTFSRFKNRLSKEAMDQINSDILRQFESKGLTINKGICWPDSSNPQVGLSAMKKSKSYVKNTTPLKERWIKMAIPKNSAGIWNQTGTP